jgi:hypothetical protein
MHQPCNLGRVAALLAVAFLPFVATAHHSRAAFDTTKEVQLEGTVTDVLWANPHIYFTIEMRGADGKAQLQEIEVGPLQTLQPLGLTRDAIVVGENVTIRANPNRRGAGHLAVGLEITKPNGEIYPLHVRSRARPAPPAAPAGSLAGRWVPVNSDFTGGMVTAPANWPLTAVGRAGLEDGAGDTQGRCVPWPSPLLMTLPMLRTIGVAADRVTIDFDWLDAKRVVRLDLTEHPSSLTPSLQGHSIGRWDGDTLVIDSRGFIPHEEGAGFGVPGGPDKHLVERLTLTPDRTRLTYEFTVEDPLSLTEPATFRMQWVHRPDLEPDGAECDLALAERFLNER